MYTHIIRKVENKVWVFFSSFELRILFLFLFVHSFIWAVMLNVMIFIFSFSINITPPRGHRHPTTTVNQSVYIKVISFYAFVHQVQQIKSPTKSGHILTSQLNNFSIFHSRPFFILTHFIPPMNPLNYELNSITFTKSMK